LRRLSCPRDPRSFPTRRSSDLAVARVRSELGDIVGIEARARRVVEAMALAFQGSLLVRHGHPAVADAFLASRLAGDEGLALGTRSEEHTSELQSRENLVCRLLL